MSNIFAIIDVETTVANELLSIGVVIGQKGNPKPVEIFYGVIKERLEEPAVYKHSIGLPLEMMGMGERPEPVVHINGETLDLDYSKVALLSKGIIGGYEKATEASLYEYSGKLDQLVQDHPIWKSLFDTEHWQHKLVYDQIKSFEQASASHKRIISLLGADTEYILEKKELAARLKDIMRRHMPAVLLAYNAKFDEEIVGPAMAKLLPNSEWRDIMQVAKNVFSNPKLTELHPFLAKFEDPNYFQNGNIKKGFSAEAIYRLLFDKSDGTAEPPESDPREVYHETHNAILDALDEFEIFKALMDDPYMYPLTDEIPELPWKGKAPFTVNK